MRRRPDDVPRSEAVRSKPSIVSTPFQPVLYAEHKFHYDTS